MPLSIEVSPPYELVAHWGNLKAWALNTDTGQVESWNPLSGGVRVNWGSLEQFLTQFRAGQLRGELVGKYRKQGCVSRGSSQGGL